MSELDRIVQITISRSTTQVSTASFNIAAILASFTNFSERTRSYTDIIAVGEDFASTSNVYKMASKLFGQTRKPASIIVGRRQVDEVDGSIATVANNTVYTVTINGTAYNYTSDASATAIEIVAGLDTAVGSLTGINFVDNLDGTFTVGPSTPGAAWSITASTNITLANVTPTETWTEALEAVENVNNTWYALTCESHVDADILELSAAIEARRKVYGTSTQASAVPTTSTTDIASQLSNLNYERTFITYLPTADTEWPECAWIGSQLPLTPGSNDWDFKGVAGITVSNITDTQRVNLRNKHCNMYTTVAGIEMFQDGNTSSGIPIDETIFIDWIYARNQEAIFFRLANSNKLIFDRAGATVIESEIRGVLSQGVTNGGIAPNPQYTVTSPDPLAIPLTQRAQRIMGDFTFQFRLGGSIRQVLVNGLVSV